MKIFYVIVLNKSRKKTKYFVCEQLLFFKKVITKSDAQGKFQKLGMIIKVRLLFFFSITD